MILAPAPSTAADARRETISAISAVMRDIGLLKRDLLRELTCDVPFAAISALGVLEEHGSMRVGELADHLGIDLSVASRHASGLEDRGLVQRSASASDRRAHQLSLTAAGADVLTLVRTDVMTRLDTAFNHWSEGDLRQLSMLLTRLRSELSPRTLRQDQVHRATPAAAPEPQLA
jgi:DNA-binding MarR family transcriptional regulator